jgi:hypothetical protein
MGLASTYRTTYIIFASFIAIVIISTTAGSFIRLEPGHAASAASALFMSHTYTNNDTSSDYTYDQFYEDLWGPQASGSGAGAHAEPRSNLPSELDYSPALTLTLCHPLPLMLCRPLPVARMRMSCPWSTLLRTSNIIMSYPLL